MKQRGERATSAVGPREGRGRVCVKALLYLVAAAAAVVLAWPRPVQATSCVRSEEVYDLRLRSIEALDGGDAQAQHAFWAREGMFRELDVCCGIVTLAPPWWGMRIECLDDPSCP